MTFIFIWWGNYSLFVQQFLKLQCHLTLNWICMNKIQLNLKPMTNFISRQCVLKMMFARRASKFDSHGLTLLTIEIHNKYFLSRGCVWQCCLLWVSMCLHALKTLSCWDQRLISLPPKWIFPDCSKTYLMSHMITKFHSLAPGRCDSNF